MVVVVVVVMVMLSIQQALTRFSDKDDGYHHGRSVGLYQSLLDD